MRKKIGIDLDTTLNNLEEVWLERYNKDYNDNLTPEDMIDWDVTKYVKPECGTKMFQYLWEPGFFRNLSIKPHAREVCEFLNQYYDLYIVTACHPKAVLDKWEWVQEHLPFMDYRHFIPLTDKSLIQMDYLIDDGPHNIEAFKNGVPIVIDMPYNRHLGYRYIRCRDWVDVLMFFAKELLLEQGGEEVS
jgi:5'-nucleotidase